MDLTNTVMMIAYSRVHILCRTAAIIPAECLLALYPLVLLIQEAAHAGLEQGHE
jgi:hypothetical protein